MKKTYVITSAQMGAKVNLRFFNSLLTICKEKKAKLQIIKLKGKGNVVEEYDEALAPYLLDMNKIYPLNPNIAINTIALNPSSENPLSGNRVKRLARDTSVILGHSQIAFAPIANSNNKLPRIMMSTGSVTEPYYASTKTGILANMEHQYGAILVEVVDDVYYFPRQLMANGNGEVHDLGVKYASNRTDESSIEALVMGDTHVNSVCPRTQKATEDMIGEFKPSFLVFHDLLDTYSVNHHHDNNYVLNTIKAIEERDNLEQELEDVAAYLVHMKKISTYSPKRSAKLIVVASNHDEALDRYITEGRWIKNKDYKNCQIAAKLFLEMIKGKSPLETFIKHYSKYKNELQDVKFLSRDDDFKIEKIQVANHGDLGANGGPASKIAMDIGVGDSVIGHSHTPGIYHNIFQTGTMTLLKLLYNRGLSSWMNAHVVIHKGGSRQLLLIIEGKYSA